MTFLPIALLLLAPQITDSLTGPGVSRELATLRRAQIADVRYALSLDVTRRDTLYGRATIRFTRRGGGDIILDFRGLSQSGMTANGSPVSPRVENGHLVVASSVLRDGSNEVALDFKSAIAPAGASVIRVQRESSRPD